jgi:hypothetical protein
MFQVVNTFYNITHCKMKNANEPIVYSYGVDGVNESLVQKHGFFLFIFNLSIHLEILSNLLYKKIYNLFYKFSSWLLLLRRC